MRLRPRDRLALGLMLAAIVVAGFYLLVLRPPLRHASQLSTQISSEQQALTQVESEYQSAHTAKHALKAQAKEWAALQRALPNQARIPALLRILQHSVDAAGVSLTSVALSGSSDSSSTTASTSTTSASKSAATVPLTLDFTGSYARLEDLVRRLGGLVVVSGGKVHASGPLMSISALTLTGSGSKLTLDLTATIYQRAAVSATTTTEGTS